MTVKLKWTLIKQLERDVLRNANPVKFILELK